MYCPDCWNQVMRINKKYNTKKGTMVQHVCPRCKKTKVVNASELGTQKVTGNNKQINYLDLQAINNESRDACIDMAF